jgi:hypothetical protein
MIAHGNINTVPPQAEMSVYDDTLDRQRGGGGFLSFLLFPMISIVAIAYAAFELMR